MLKDIANNEEIDTIYEKWQEKLGSIRKRLNKLLKESFEDWQIPREAQKDWPKEAKDLLKEWWQLRQRRQKEIDASICVNFHKHRILAVVIVYENQPILFIYAGFLISILSIGGKME